MEDEVTRFAAMLGALGQAARLSIVRLLLGHRPQGLVAGEIRDALDVPASTLSFHLDALCREGLLTQTREGRYVRYQADEAALLSIARYLLEDCCRK